MGGILVISALGIAVASLVALRRRQPSRLRWGSAARPAGVLGTADRRSRGVHPGGISTG